MNMPAEHKSRIRKTASPFRLLFLCSLLLLLTSCGMITPEAYTPQEIRERVIDDRKAMYADQEPITAPITFHEALARALKYNLDYRLKLMESSLSKSLLDVSSYEMLPRLVAGAGYLARNNDSGGTSNGIDTGLETLSPSTSQERQRVISVPPRRHRVKF